MMPLMGPAWAQLPRLSQMVLLLVRAFAVSMPDDTEVVRMKIASAEFAKPEPLSVAVHAIATSPACQSPSVAPHWIVGGVVSGGVTAAPRIVSVNDPVLSP